MYCINRYLQICALDETGLATAFVVSYVQVIQDLAVSWNMVEHGHWTSTDSSVCWK